MWDQLNQLKQIKKEFRSRYPVVNGEPPLFVVGDIVHRWNEPAELINFILKNMPDCYAIPGNHDLPFHNLANIEKSAYWTLVAAGKVKNMDLSHREMIGHTKVEGSLTPIWVEAFPFGTDPEPLQNNLKNHIYIAIVHHYVWEEGHAFPGCPQEDHVSIMRTRLDGYHAAFFGDNHKGFYSGYKALCQGKDMPIVNCGAFLRRKSGDIDYDPSVWLLRRSGRIERRLLNCPDKMVKVREDVEDGKKKINIKKFMQLVSGMDTESNDFKEYLNRLLRDMGKKHLISKDCQRLIVQILTDL